MSSDWDPRVSEADEAMDAMTEAAEQADTETGVQAAGFDLEAFRLECIHVHELLNQAVYWIDVHRRRLPIREMSVGYKANCLAFMRKRAVYFASRYPWGAIYAMDLPSGWTEVWTGTDVRAVRAPQPVSRAEFLLDDGGNMSHAFDEHMDEVDRQIRRSPGDWLDSTPLMRALSDQVLAGEGGEIGTRPEDQPRTVPRDALCPQPACGLPVGNTVKHRRSLASPLLARLCTGEWVRLVR